MWYKCKETELTMKQIAAVIFCLFAALIHAEEPWIETTEPVTIEVRGIVVDPEGMPVPGAVVRSDFDGVQCETDGAGRFVLSLTMPQYRRLRIYRPDKSQIALSTFLHKSQADPKTGEFRIPLVPARKLTGRVVDAEGKPVPGATVWSTSINNQGITDIAETDDAGNFTLHHPSGVPLGLVVAKKSGLGIDFLAVNETDSPSDGPFTIPLTGARTVRFKAVDGNDNPLEGIEFSVWVFRKGNEHLNPVGLEFIRQKTDVAGIAVFDWLPNWTMEPVEFAGRLRETLNRLMPQTLHVDLQVGLKEVTAVFEPGVFVRGTVLLPDGGPAVNWNVVLDPTDKRWRNFQTDRRGRYEFYVERNQTFRIYVRQRDDVDFNPTTAPDAVAPTRFGMNSGETGLDGLDFRLVKPVRVFGEIKGNPPPGEPGHQSQVRIAEGNPEFFDSDNDGQAFWNSPFRCANVKPDGTFQCWLAPGTFKLRIDDQLSHDKSETKTVIVADLPEIRVDFEVKQDTKYRDVTVRLELPDGTKTGLDHSLTVLFEQRKENGGNPYMMQKNAVAEASMVFKVPGREMEILAVSPDHRFGKYAKLSPETSELTLRLEPTGTVSGILTNDRKNNEPLARRRVEARPKGAWIFPQAIVLTDDQGRFEFTGFVPGIDYELQFTLEPRDWPGVFRAWQSLKTVKAESGKSIDIGTVPCNPILGGHDEFSWAFWGLYIRGHGGKNFDSLFRELLDRAKKENRRLLVLFTENEFDSMYHRFTHFDLAPALYGDPDVASIFERFLFMGVPTDKPSRHKAAFYDKAKVFAKRLGFDEDVVDQPTLCVFGADGKLLHVDDLSEIMEYGPIQGGKPKITVNKAGLLEFLNRWTEAE